MDHKLLSRFEAGIAGLAATLLKGTKKPRAGEGAGLVRRKCASKLAAYGGSRREAAPTRLLLRGLEVSDRCLRGGQAGDGHAVRRARDVAQAELVTELHGLRVAAVFAV